MAQLFLATGHVTILNPESKEGFTLPELERLLGGNVTIDPAWEDAYRVTLLKAKEVGCQINSRATDFLISKGSTGMVYGDALVVSSQELEGVSRKSVFSESQQAGV